MGNKESVHEPKTPHYDKLLSHFEKHSILHGNQKYMSRDGFKESMAFPDALVGDLLFNFLYKRQLQARHDKECTMRSGKEMITKENFIHGVEEVLQHTGEEVSAAAVKFYFSLFSDSDNNTMSMEDMNKMLNVVMATMLAASCIDKESLLTQECSVIQSMIKAMANNSTETVNVAWFCSWTCQNSPGIFASLQLWIRRVLLLKEPHAWSALPLLPDPLPKTCCLSYDLLWGLSTVLPGCYLLGKTKSENPPGPSKPQEPQISCSSSWSLLYSSDEHGQSMNRFKHHCLSYRGPTVMLISTVQDILLAVCVDMEWRDSSQSWGGKNCMLVQVLPEFKLIQRDERMIFLNERSRGVPTGLRIGSPISKPMVAIETDMTSAKFNFVSMDTEIRNIEVWGCGGQEAEEAQRRQQKWEKSQAEKLRKVKLPGEWDENPDKAILEMAGITTSHAQR